ncbi:MAG TPA: MerR family transcriptional regulator [Solirubrobacteraceae bacterium]|nr:MerR family transcriptional regulator [Solirubrobacteraceae bacterium]
MADETRYRIGDVAERVGTTPRTIRYYEEMGLLPAPPAHEKGRHRTYGDSDVRRLQELIRLRDLLGVSLDELRSLVESEEARSLLRERWLAGAGDRRAILEQSRRHVSAQLEIVRSRRRALEQLEAELAAKLERVDERLRE